MTDKVVIQVTCADAAEADKIARALVEKRLAACVQIIPQIRSIYRWEGKVEEATELMLWIKSSRGLFERVRAEVEALHSYHVPEVVCLSITDGAENYMAWLDDSLATEDIAAS